MLTGREAELARLHRGLERARRGHGGLVAVVGEAGIGKSRLVDELAGGARGRLPVLIGRAVDGDGSALRPFTEALLAGLRRGPPPDVPGLAAFHPALGRLLPHWRPAAGPPAVADPVPWLAEGLLRLLRALATPPGRTPGLVLVLEDLHWSDPDTLTVLEYLADNAAAEPVLLVATGRDGPGPWPELLQRLSARGAAEVVAPGPLSAAAVSAMARACLDRPVPGEVTARVAARSGGVPLLVEELLAADPSGTALPPDHAAGVRDRTAALSPRARRVLRLAAVLGERVDRSLLPAASGAEGDAVRDALDEAARAGLLEGTGPGGVPAFRHALTRDAVLADVWPAERAELAGAALEAVLATGDGERGGLAARLAEEAGEPDRAADLLVGVGRAERRRGALATARDALDRATLLARDPLVATAVAEELAEVLVQAGLPQPAAAVTERLLARLDGLDAAVSRRVGAVLRLARAHATAGQWDSADARIAHARDLGVPGPAADLCAAHVAIGRNRFAEAERLAAAVLDATVPAGPHEPACEALELLGRVARRTDLARAQLLFERGHALAEAHDLPVWRVRALHELSTVDLFTGLRTDRAERAVAEASGLGALALATTAEFHLAVLRCWRGETGAALEHLGRVVPACDRLGLPVQAMAAAVTAEVHADRGEAAAALAQAGRARSLAPDDAHVAAVAEHVTATLALLAEDRAAALTALDRALVHIAQDSDTTSGPPLGRWVLVAALERGRVALDAVAGYPGRSLARWTVAHVHWAEAVCHGRAGDRVAAERAFAAGQRAFTEPVPIPHFLHVGRRLVAEAALADGWGDPAGWLAEDLAWFTAAGFEAPAAACRRMLRHTGARIARPGPVAPALRRHGVTAREAEVLGLLTAGLSNRDIAARLGLSHRTVEKHVERLLAKTGSGGRAELAVRSATGDW